jgi:hypothetical protein
VTLVQATVPLSSPDCLVGREWGKGGRPGYKQAMPQLFAPPRTEQRCYSFLLLPPPPPHHSLSCLGSCLVGKLSQIAGIS